MASDKERPDPMRKYALRWLRDEVMEISDRVTELREDFPDIDALLAVEAELSAAVEVLDELSIIGDDRDQEFAHTRARARARGESALAPKLGQPPKPAKRGRPPKNAKPVKPAQPAKRPSTKPSKPAKGAGAQPTKPNGAKIISWLKGRDVLALMAKAPDGRMRPEQIAEALTTPSERVTRAAIYFRLQVRRRKGHVMLVDENTTTFQITPLGRTAYAKNEDNEDLEANG